MTINIKNPTGVAVDDADDYYTFVDFGNKRLVKLGCISTVE